MSPPAHRHELGYVTSHKGPVLCSNFSHDGNDIIITKYFIILFIMVITLYSIIYVLIILIVTKNSFISYYK